jgi:hypothetical protein
MNQNIEHATAELNLFELSKQRNNSARPKSNGWKELNTKQLNKVYPEIVLRLKGSAL